MAGLFCFAISVTQQERLKLAQAFQVVLTAGKVVHHRGQLLFGGADFAFHIKEGCAIFILQGLNLADKAVHHGIGQLGKLVRKGRNRFLLQQLQHLRIGQPLNGLFGQGLGQSIQKLGFLPESQNDMIFAIICEELGLVGAGILLLLFLMLIWRFFLVSVHAPDLFGSLIAAGVMGHISIQVILNVAVVTNTIPNTGITLPFVSYGGTSILFLLAEMGLVLGISRKC